MKKILIALPLVLIMILSMVPVMAADKTINVEVKYYDTPDLKKVVKTEVRAIEVTDAELADAAALKAKVEKEVAGFGFPMLDTDNQPSWTVKATVTAQSQGAATYDVAETKLAGTITYEALKTFANDKGIKFDERNVAPAMINGPSATHKYVKDQFIIDYNNLIAGLADGSISDRVLVVDPANLAKLPKNASVDKEVKYLIEKAGAVTEATASAVAYPNCFVDPKAPVKQWCPELCRNITVRIYDVANQWELERFMRVYEVDPHKLPTYDGILDHYKKNYFPAGYQILKTWNNRDYVEKPEWVEKDCVIWINVVPLFQHVNVLHRLMDCCETLDGDVDYTVWKQFWEANVVVPFIEYHSTLVVNEEKAAEWANTRLQKINATDFVYVKADFDDGIRLDGYMTGKVYNMDGNVIDIVYNELPQITLIYHRVGCDKEEQKVDNATVENTNTQAPVTASGTQLPATGAKDVTAFFLSAVALLGLGIFFAKKH